MSGANRPRALARLAAVQALYQMDLSGIGVEAVIREFETVRFVSGEHPPSLAGADGDWFAKIVRGVVADQGAIDERIAARLAKGWRLERLDATVRAILRCGAHELMRHPEIPREVTIDQFVEIAKAFHPGAEVGFVNGALDQIAADVGRG